MGRKEEAVEEEEAKSNSDPQGAAREADDDEPKKLSAWAAERQAFLGNKRVYDLGQEDSETKDYVVREWGDAGHLQLAASQTNASLSAQLPM